MRVQFHPPSASQLGRGAFPVYRGLPYQRGAGLGSIFRGILCFVLPFAKSAGKSIGREALRSGADLATDLLEGHSLEESVKQRAKEGVKRVLRQKGKGLGKPTGKGAKAVPIKGRAQRKKVTKRKQKADSLGLYYP